MTKPRLTPIFITLVVGLLISIPATFYYLFIENGGGMALAGVLAGIFSVITFVILILERVIISYISVSQKKLWIIEAVIIIVFLFAYSFRQPTYYFKVNDNIEWFGILYGEQKVDRKAKYSFPNNKVLTIQNNEILFINQQEIGDKSIDIKSSGAKWKGYQSVTKEFDVNGKEVSCILYSPYGHSLSDTELLKVENILRGKVK